jgi:AraC-like DNA-binding protein
MGGGNTGGRGFLCFIFKEKTGSAILEYLTLLRIEYASTMINNPEYTIEYIASRCGFKTARQLQRILKK